MTCGPKEAAVVAAMATVVAVRLVWFWSGGYAGGFRFVVVVVVGGQARIEKEEWDLGFVQQLQLWGRTRSDDKGK